MQDNREAKPQLAATWKGRMGQVTRCELPYEQALQVVLECVEIAERYSPPESQSMSPADADAEFTVPVNLPSTLECDVRLAVYSLYHGDNLVEHDQAVERLLNCGKLSDNPV